MRAGARPSCFAASTPAARSRNDLATSAWTRPTWTRTSPGTSEPKACRDGSQLLLDAPLVLQRYSRLVIDCNRPFDDAGSAFAEVSDGTRGAGQSTARRAGAPTALRRDPPAFPRGARRLRSMRRHAAASSSWPSTASRRGFAGIRTAVARRRPVQPRRPLRMPFLDALQPANPG